MWLRSEGPQPCGEGEDRVRGAVAPVDDDVVGVEGVDVDEVHRQRDRAVLVDRVAAELERLDDDGDVVGLHVLELGEVDGGAAGVDNGARTGGAGRVDPAQAVALEGEQVVLGGDAVDAVPAAESDGGGDRRLDADLVVVDAGIDEDDPVGVGRQVDVVRLRGDGRGAGLVAEGVDVDVDDAAADVVEDDLVVRPGAGGVGEVGDAVRR